MQRIKKGDDVVVLSGRDKGKRGTVVRRVDAGVEAIDRKSLLNVGQREHPADLLMDPVDDRSRRPAGSDETQPDAHIEIRHVGHVRNRGNDNSGQGPLGECGKRSYLPGLDVRDVGSEAIDRDWNVASEQAL